MKEQNLYDAEATVFNFTEDLLVHIEGKHASRESLSEITGIKPKRLEKILSADSDMSLLEAAKLSKATNISLDSLLKDDFSKNDVDLLKSLSVLSPSILAKFIEASIATNCTSGNLGDDDSSDLYIGYFDSPEGIECSEPFVIAREELGISVKSKNTLAYSKKYNCKSFENGFSIEVKCTRGNDFNIKQSSAHQILSNGESHALDFNHRPSDFYLLIDIHKPSVEEIITHPLKAIKNVYLVSTYAIEKYLESNPKSSEDSKTIAKSVIEHKFNVKVPLPDSDFTVEELWYRIYALATAIMGTSYKEVVERKFLEDGKKASAKVKHKTNSTIS